MNIAPDGRPEYICKPATFLGLKEIPKSLLESCAKLTARLRSKIYPMPSYERLAGLNIRLSNTIKPRTSIQEVVDERRSFNFNFSESMFLEQCSAEIGKFSEGSIFDMANAAKLICFGTLDPLREYNLTIRFLRELIIHPPLKNSDLYKPVHELFHGDPVAYALKAYLILLSEHPYRDGNGRVARLVFSSILRQKVNPGLCYIPLSDLTLLTFGSYEECFANATITGDYNEIFALLVSVVEQYTEFLDNENYNIQAVNIDTRINQLECPNIEALPPLKLTFNDFFSKNKDIFDPIIFKIIKNLACDLQKYGKVNYALFTDCAEDKKTYSRPAITYFILTEDIAELTKNIRSVRAPIESFIIFHVIPVFDEPATDAKLLLTQYLCYSRHSKDYPQLITNFLHLDDGMSRK